MGDKNPSLAQMAGKLYGTLLHIEGELALLAPHVQECDREYVDNIRKGVDDARKLWDQFLGATVLDSPPAGD